MKKRVDYEKVEKVVHAFSDLMAGMDGDEWGLNNPVPYYPESALPYPKEIIAYALDQWSELAGKQGNNKLVDTLGVAKVTLGMFIPDEEAREKRESLLRQPVFIEELFKFKNRSND